MRPGTSKRARRIVIGAALGLLAALSGARASDRCAVPDGLTSPAAGLPQLARAVERGLPIRIVALGSGTTAGMGASSPAAGFPARLERALSARLRGEVSVVNAGMLRQTAADMLARLERDVLAQRPTLVLWETGTVDAVRGVALAEFTTQLEAGIARLRAAGADVLLIDPQYARYAARMVNILPFVEAMRTVAASDGLPLFDRFEVMRHWIDNGVFRLDEPSAARTAAEADAVYDCIGTLLAHTILRALPGGALAAR